MGRSELLREIKEINLAYLLLVQRLVREDRMDAALRLDVSTEIAGIVCTLTSDQLVKLSTSNMVLCRIRLSEHALLYSLGQAFKSHEVEGPRGDAATLATVVSQVNTGFDVTKDFTAISQIARYP